MDQAKWNQRYKAKELVWSSNPNQLLQQEVDAIDPGIDGPGTALDLGCGEGRNAIWLAEQGWRVTAIDFASEGIGKARKLAQSKNAKVEWRCADVMHYAMGEGEYDLIVMVFLHIPAEQRRRLLVRCNRALKMPGHFIYVGHDIANIEYGQGGPQDPDVLTDADTLHDILGNLTKVKAELVKRRVSVEPQHGGSGDGYAYDTLFHGVRMRAPGDAGDS